MSGARTPRRFEDSRNEILAIGLEGWVPVARGKQGGGELIGEEDFRRSLEREHPARGSVRDSAASSVT